MTDEWTVGTLRAHLVALFREKDLRDQQRFDAQQLALRDALIAQERAVAAALLASQDAVNKAETAAEKRFDAVNEFRAQLADQAATLMPRNETMVLLETMAERVSTLEKRVNESAGHGRGITDLGGYIVGAVGVLAAIGALIAAILR